MDKHSKSGKAYLQPHKAGKKWKPVWLSLFAPSSSGVGRLEIQDLGGAGDYGTAGRRHPLPHGDRKVVRLSELLSVLRLPPNAEACPKENMSAFCVESRERTMVFAAPKDECVDWVEKLCQSTFQRGGASASTQLHMEDNLIYASADEVQASEFWVAVQRTEAASRCGLQGSYRLHVGPEALQLTEAHNADVVREWPYELLRRYGKDGEALTIEAGRRCDSGPGTFVFETQQAERIFSLIQSSIRRKSPNEGPKGAAAKARSPLPRTPDAAGTASLLESNAQIQAKNRCSLEDAGDPAAQPESVAAHPAPITLMPLPSVPTLSRSFREPDVVYANPGDVQSGPTAHYVDPVSVLPLKPPTAASVPQPCFNIDPDSGYSEVYDKINPVQTKQKARDEPVYTEPVKKKEETPHAGQTKSDPFAHLYAQVCKTGRSPSPASNDEPPVDDVIYESLGVI